MSDTLTLLPTFDEMTLLDVSKLSLEQMAALPFGITGLSADGLVEVYSATEARLAGLSAESVLGQHYFSVTAQCMNNFLVAQRFEDEESLNEVLDYVLTLRMRPTPVRLKLLKGPEVPLRYLLIQRTR